MKPENPNRRELERRPAATGIQDDFSDWNFYEHWDLAEIMTASSKKSSEDYKGILHWCAGLIDASPTGRRILGEAKDQNWRVGLSDLSGKDFYIDVPQKLLLLDNHGLSPCSLAKSAYFRHDILLNGIRALRDIWQEKRHGGFDEDYGPEAILMLERVRAADGDAMTSLIAWELRAAGNPEIWRHLIGTETGDIALAFSECLERNPASAFTHKALEIAFRQWYSDEARVNACDHETLEYLDCVLRDTSGGNPFGPARLTRVAVEILSCLPDKTAYLQGQGGSILQDPAYYGMADAINQSHLFHIMHDLQAVRAGGIAFRDARLAGLIFPPAPKNSGKTRVS
jgi:hypothetical protein